MKKEKKFKIKKISNKKDKIMVGLFMEASKKAAERIDKNTLKLLIGRYGKSWVLKQIEQ